MGGESDQLVDEAGGCPDLGESKFDQNKSWDGAVGGRALWSLHGGAGEKNFGDGPAATRDYDQLVTPQDRGT